jgi:ribosome-associated protein
VRRGYTAAPRARLLARKFGADRLTTSLELAHRIAALAADKLAADIVILDMSDVVTYTDYFVICSGRTARQTQAVAAEIREALKRDRILARGVDGERQGDWILLDFLDVVVHVFTPDARAFYRLESLWGEVPSESFATGA